MIRGKNFLVCVSVWRQRCCERSSGLCLYVSQWRPGKLASPSKQRVMSVYEPFHLEFGGGGGIWNFLLWFNNWIFSGTPEPQLPRYIDKLTNEMKESGNLEGILLTGLTKDGVDLMESYVDRTGDVQTASFCMLKVLKSRQRPKWVGR